MRDATPGRAGLQWYADAWPRRARQLVLDGAVAVWCLGWLAVGLGIHQLVAALVSPTRSLADRADDVGGRLSDAGEGLGEVPLVGDEAAVPLDAAASSMAGIADSTQQVADLVGDLGLALAVAVPLTPVSLVLVLWLPARLRFARRAAAARQLLLAGADPQLFALRALTTQPLSRLREVAEDPAGAWRRGDPATTRALARLELQRLGVDTVDVTDRTPLGSG